MAFNRSYTHTVRRLVTYLLLWIAAAALLGLTAYRIHRTRSRNQGYERIMAELLATSVLTILWVPMAIFLLLAQRAVSATQRHNSVRSSRMHPRLPVEMAGNLLLWLLFLIGAVYTTNRILPGRNYCVVPGMDCNILTSILAFAWISWSLLTILGVFGLMHYSSAGRSNTTNTTSTEKSRNGVTTTTAPINAGNTIASTHQPLV